MRYSVVVTAAKEPELLRRALEAILPQVDADAEVIVVAPDNETQHVARAFLNVKVYQDEGKGKPLAVNMGMEHARGDMVVLTDGDVIMAKNAIQQLLAPFANAKVGLVSGRPVPREDRSTKFGYFAHVLTDAAHDLRRRKSQEGDFFEGSGYLLALQRKIFSTLSADTLSDDAVISHTVHNKGFKTAYAPLAYVWVKFPDNYHDWFIQKIRSTGGYTQVYIRRSKKSMRSFGKELRSAYFVWSYAKNMRERLWTVELIIARLILWARIYFTIHVAKRPFSRVWRRVESTKKM